MEKAKVKELHRTDVLMIDEISMMDVDIWQGIEEVMSIVDHNRRPRASAGDNFGHVHVVLFGDYKHSAEQDNICTHVHKPPVSCVLAFSCICDCSPGSCRQPQAEPHSSWLPPLRAHLISESSGKTDE